jgi:GxxExxY protein
MVPTKSYLKDLTYRVTGAAIEVHKRLGAGLLESVYHKCLAKELEIRGINHLSEYKVPFNYKGYDVNVDLRCDFLIEGMLVVEIKSAEKFIPIFDAQLLTYMKLLEVPKGLLINFNVDNLYAKGHKTLVNELFRELID